jgi:uncharacterized RDD family membrane protein YckC
MTDPAAVPPPPPEGGFAPPPGPGAPAGVPFAGLQLSSKGKRLGEYLLEILLIIVTLFIGWFIWWIILLPKAQSPAKQLLKMRVVSIDEPRAATLNEMLLRELVGKWLLGFIPFYSFVAAIFVLIDDNNQALWDKVAKTTVVDDPDNAFGF